VKLHVEKGAGMKSLLQQIVDRSKLMAQRPDPRKIISITFAVTYLCNSRCKMCNIWKKYITDPAKQSEELQLDEIRQIFTSSEYLRNLQQIHLTGGEMFLREDFVELCGFLIDKYPEAEISISTNPLDPESTAAKLEQINSEYRPKNILVHISLDGIGKTHDEMRGVAGAYDGVLKLIEALKERAPSIEQNVSFTITPNNYKDLSAVYELSRKLGVGFGVVFAQTSQVYYDNVDNRFDWDDASLNEVEKVIDAIITEGGRAKRLLPRILRKIGSLDTCYLANMVKHQRYHQRICKCYSGTHSFFLDPYGNIFPCIMLDWKIGNIRESNFDDIWTSEKAQQVREFITEGKCSCWVGCETYLSLMRSPNVIVFNLSKVWV